MHKKQIWDIRMAYPNNFTKTLSYIEIQFDEVQDKAKSNWKLFILKERKMLTLEDQHISEILSNQPYSGINLLMCKDVLIEENQNYINWNYLFIQQQQFSFKQQLIMLNVLSNFLTFKKGKIICIQCNSF
ncbi:unnamed protein product (macronuclear) [Paramecium tetraurelia]|uniref:Uncharacterized protein n=1 Tax=Paramecium tetraurelia TaxID=5888 RepID=A0C6L1_PARTE|nr:uncharacterized protein GSPATT00035557001 [Paramecium tetraurelia]CAK66428.1 unnamed protein product [Paramecium tetraurelia]|eukprot:XP_001433825.1 hypothetical protein (macronuclear) [Paramecium tetraurelia strain d4-2]